MAWFDELNLPGSTITGRFAFVTEDGPDDDEFPDVRLASGTVLFEPTAKAVRAGGAWIGIDSVPVTIFDGELVVSEEDPRPVRILSSDADTGVENWGWIATFNIPGANIKPIRFRAPASGVHLTGDDLIPITGLPVEIIGAGAMDRLVTAEDLLVTHGKRLSTVEAVAADAAETAVWANVTGKPSTFPPEAHTHSVGDVDGLQGTLDDKVDDADPRLTDARTPKAHSHPVDEIDGLDDVLDGKAGMSTVTASRAAGASAGTFALTATGPVIVADLTGVVLTGTSETVASIPADYRPGHKAGHGFVEASDGDWWPVRATTSSIEILGPAPAGTTVEGTLTWSI